MTSRTENCPTCGSHVTRIRGNGDYFFIPVKDPNLLKRIKELEEANRKIIVILSELEDSNDNQ